MQKCTPLKIHGFVVNKKDLKKGHTNVEENFQTYMRMNSEY